MKYLNFYFVFICMSLFISCDKENNIDEPDPEPWYMGYFEGTVNGTFISVKNTADPDRPIKPGGYIIMSDGIDEHWWSVPINDLRLEIVLTPLTEGRHKITSGKNEYRQEWCRFVKGNDSETGDLYYPSEDAVEINIKSKKFKPDSVFPYLEGTMSGTFCNVNDPDDRIVLEDVKFGIH